MERLKSNCGTIIVHTVLHINTNNIACIQTNIFNRPMESTFNIIQDRPLQEMLASFQPEDFMCALF